MMTMGLKQGPKMGLGKTTAKKTKLRTILTTLGLGFFMAACTTSGIELKSPGGVSTLGKVRATPRKSGDAVYKDLAHHFLDQGNYAMAIPMFRQAIRSKGRSPSLLNGLAESLIAVGQYNEAIKTYKASLNRDGSNASALLGLGNAYLAFGDLPLAESFYRSALVAGYSGTAPHAGLAITLDANGRHDEAMSVMAEGLNHHIGDVDLLNNKALSLVLHGEVTDAIEILEALVRKSGSSIEMRQNLALAYTFNGEHDKAIAMAAIDYDAELSAEAVSNFGLLKGLDPATRTRALLYGIINEREDREQAANLKVTGDEETKLETAKRLTEKEPEPKPEPVKKPIMLPKPKPKIELPPMIEPEGWAVQIAAYRFAREVMPGWRKLHKKYNDIIGDLEPRRSEVDFGERDGKGPQGSFYRLNAGPLENFKLAFEVCQKLIAAGGECWIRPPEPAEGKLPAKGDDAEGDSAAEDSEKSADDLKDLQEIDGVKIVKESGAGIIPKGYEPR
jgi:Flp pilus assembly protein TadD